MYQKDEQKKEKKLVVYSGFGCNYCDGKNHFAKECILRKKNENRDKEKYEAFYVTKIKDLQKIKLGEKALTMEDDNNNNGYVDVWLTDFVDKEVRKQTHGACFIVNKFEEGSGGKFFMLNIVSSGSHRYYYDEGEKYDVCLSTKSIRDHVAETETIINKVQYILESVNILISLYNSKLTKLNDTIYEFIERLKWNLIRTSNLYDDLSRVSFKSEERRLWIEHLEIILSGYKDDIILLKRDNRFVMKQHHICCQISYPLYNNITQLYLNCDITKEMHKKSYHS